MTKIVKVMIACGSGVATSTIAQEKVEKLAAEAGVSISIIKCTLAEVPTRQQSADLILTTANYRKALDKPYLSVFGLVSGINEEKVKSDVTALLKQLAE